MAKAKKPASTGAPKKPAQPAPQAPAPLVDTNQTANLAARLIANRAKVATELPAGKKTSETSMFKQLKQQASKPHISDALQKIAPPTSSRGTLHQQANKQIGHNQTFSDVSRTGVPRRTPG